MVEKNNILSDLIEITYASSTDSLERIRKRKEYLSNHPEMNKIIFIYQNNVADSSDTDTDTGYDVDWAEVAKGLGSAALKWIAGKYLAQGHLDPGNLTNNDLAAMLKAAVIQLTINFRGILRENELDRIQLEVKGIRKNLENYLLAPASSAAILAQATYNITNAVEALTGYGIDALGAYMIAQGVQVLISQENYKASKDIGQLSKIEHWKGDLISDYKLFYESAVKRNRSFFGPIQDVMGICFCTFDGKKIPLGQFGPESVNNYEYIITKNFVEQFLPKLETSLNIITEVFDRIKTKNI